MTSKEEQKTSLADVVVFIFDGHDFVYPTPEE